MIALLIVVAAFGSLWLGVRIGRTWEHAMIVAHVRKEAQVLFDEGAEATRESLARGNSLLVAMHVDLLRRKIEANDHDPVEMRRRKRAAERKAKP